MATNIKLIPRANQNLLSGQLQASLSDTATYFVANNPPSALRLPTFLWIDKGQSNAELVKAYDVSGNNVYIKRGLNNGGVGLSHNNGAEYKETITIEHWNTLADAIEEGWVAEQTDVYTFTQVSTTQFKIEGVDRTNYYPQGKEIRFNGTIKTEVSSSSYSGGDTLVSVSGAVVPASISSVEINIGVNSNILPAIDEDDMASNSDTKVPTQQSVKAYVDTPRYVTATSYTTNTGTSLNVDNLDVFIITAQAGALKFNNPSGTPKEGQKFIIRIKDNGTARALTYDTQYRASSDLPLPTTTVPNKVLYMGFMYNSTDNKWDLLAVLNNI